MANLPGAFVRRQELHTTAAEMNVYPDVVLMDGEIIYIEQTDGTYGVKIGDGVTRIIDLAYIIRYADYLTAKDAAEKAATDAKKAANDAVNVVADAQSTLDSIDDVAAAADRYYQGVDLTVKFADEIAASPYNGDPWAWIKARIKAVNYKGLHDNDYIPWTSKNGKKVKSCIAGFDTYRNFAEVAIGHHIDFISRDLWYERHVMNSVGYNNGITKMDGTAVEHPWLASDLYHWLNALAGEVPGGTAVGGAPVAVDYTTTGVYAFLPDELKAVIIPKRMYLPTRYSASGTLTSDNACAWVDIGNLWIPAEMEVAGAPIWGDANYGAMSFVQYPIFNCNANRIKGLGDGGVRTLWWTLSAASGDNTHFVNVSSQGYINSHYAHQGNKSVPVCFRINDK